MLRLVSLFLVLCLAACASQPAFAPPPEFADPAPIAADGATLTVHGLGCPQCASNIDLQLRSLAGVERVDVDLGEGRVDVGFAVVPRPSKLDLARAIHASGFTLVGIETR